MQQYLALVEPCHPCVACDKRSHPREAVRVAWVRFAVGAAWPRGPYGRWGRWAVGRVGAGVGAARPNQTIEISHLYFCRVPKSHICIGVYLKLTRD